MTTTVAPTARRRSRALWVLAALFAAAAFVVAILVDKSLRASFAPTVVEPQPSIPTSSSTERRRSEPDRSSESLVSTVSPAVGAPKAPREVRGRVVDLSNAAIAAAHVVVIDAYDRQVGRSTTNQDGDFCIPDSDARGVSVIARSRGHQTQVVALAPARPEAIAITLEPAAAIVGRVRLADGGIPARPVRVMVRSPVRLTPVRWSAIDSAKAALIDDLRVLSTTTDASGDFSIDGLPRNVWCTLTASGPGLATATRNGSDVIEAQAGGAAVEIVVSPLYVLDVRVRTAEGAVPAASTLVSATPGCLSWSSAYANRRVLAPGDPALCWTGVDLTGESDPFRLLLAYPLDSSADRVGPFHITVRIPAYEPITADVWAVRAYPDQNIVPQELHLGSSVTDVGTVRVRIDDGGTGFSAALRESASTDRSMRHPRLVLSPDRSRTTAPKGVGELSVLLSSAAEGPIDVPGVPVGDYVGRVALLVGGSSKTISGFEVHVEKGTVCDVNVAVAEWSALRLDLRLAGDSDPPYRGTVTVALRSSESNHFDYWRFSQPPFLAVGLKPGEYEVELTHPSFSAENFRVVIARNAVTSVRRVVVMKQGPLFENR